MKIGYARVSTVEQNEARQMEALREEGVDKIYMDKKSGKPRKITVAELEEKLGYPVEIVS